MAVRYIAMKKDGSSSTAREISESYAIPYDFVSKVLQRLSRRKIINSLQGIKGGYSLSRKPEEISLIEVIEAIEPTRLTKCAPEMMPSGKEKVSKDNCSHIDRCKIRDPLAKVQIEVDKVFRNTKISHIL